MNAAFPLKAIPAAVSSVVPSTATEAQELWMVRELQDAGPAGRTTDDFRAGGVYQVSARIWSLRQQGYVIHTELYNGYGADRVYHCRMARYRLISEPLGLEPKKRRKDPKAGAEAQDAGGAVCE